MLRNLSGAGDAGVGDARALNVDVLELMLPRPMHRDAFEQYEESSFSQIFFGCGQLRQEPGQAVFHFIQIFQFAFPKREDVPTECKQLLLVLSVPAPIPVELWAPILDP